MSYSKYFREKYLQKKKLRDAIRYELFKEEAAKLQISVRKYRQLRSRAISRFVKKHNEMLMQRLYLPQ